MRLSALALLWLVPAAAGAGEIDLSTRTDSSGSEFRVGICARPSPTGGILDGKPGHMFVSFSQTYPDGGHDFVALGHTTDAGAAAALTFASGEVEGVIREEVFTHIHQDCLTVKVNREDFERAQNVVVNGQALADLIGVEGPVPVYEDYTLGAEDCMGFALDVARVLEPLGLVVPERGTTELPMDYLRRLLAAN